MSIKIHDDDINNCNSNLFGEWINEKLIVNKYPFKYIIIDNFLKDNIYDTISSKYPDNIDNNWHVYDNPIEVKYTLDNFENIDIDIKNLFFALSSDNIKDKIGEMFNINNLEYDPYCNGGGLHIYPKYGRLNMHLDYEKHPILNKQRRLNVIYYVNNDWKSEWNGDTQLWDKDVKNCVVKSYPKKNTAIIFETTEDSWHGVPEIINCPNNYYRKTIAYYYISNIENQKNKNKLGANENGYRTKAIFSKTYNDIYDKRMEELYKIRPFRRIEKEDMDKIWPEWRKEIL